jgi:hypothetical protein
MAVARNAVRGGLRIVAMVTLLSLATVPGMAQEGGTPTLAFTDRTGAQPGVFDVIAGPGDTATVPLQVRAGGDAPIEAEIRIANVTSAVNGGVQVVGADATRAEPATWLEVATGTVTVAPDSVVERPVTVRIPAGVEPGLYVAAVVARAAAPVAIPDSESSQVVGATALVAILVEGDAGASFELDAPTLVRQGRGNVIQVGIVNTGNLPVLPAGTLTLTSASGDQVAGIPVRMGAVFAGTSTVLAVPLSPLPPAGTYSLTLNLKDADTGATASIDDGVLVIPAGLEEPVATPVDEAPATAEATRIDAAAQADVRFEHASVRAEGQPLLSVYVEASIANTGSPIQPARLVLVATHNGNVVDEAVLADRMSLATGVTTISTRYAPEEGFGTGIWTFSLRLESVDDNGTVSVIAQTNTVAKIDLT